MSPSHRSLRWLDSSKTLYEQDVKEGDLLYLRFKYYAFMGIDARVRGHLVGGSFMSNGRGLVGVG